MACETIDLHTFFTFFSIPKNMTFYVFLVVTHVFSNTGSSSRPTGIVLLLSHQYSIVLHSEP